MQIRHSVVGITLVIPHLRFRIGVKPPMAIFGRSRLCSSKHSVALNESYS